MIALALWPDVAILAAPFAWIVAVCGAVIIAGKAPALGDRQIERTRRGSNGKV